MTDYAGGKWQKITTIDRLLADDPECRERGESRALGFQRALAQYALKDVGTRLLKEAGCTSGGRRRGVKEGLEVPQFSNPIRDSRGKK
jgi:hypothetical protein